MELKMTEVRRLLVDEALELLKRGDTTNARLKLSIPASVTDNDFVQGMVALEKGAELFKQGRQPEAKDYFQKALPMINNSIDEEAKVLVRWLLSISEGISRLLCGDAHGALPFFEFSNDVLERISFFIPDFKKIAFSSKAMVYISLARANLNAGEIATAETWAGKAYDQYAQLLTLLDPKHEEDIPAFVEIYGTRLESVVTFARFDLEALDLDNLEKRLTAVRDDSSKLREFIEKSSAGPIQNVAKVLLILYSIMKDLHSLEKDIVFSRLPINKNRIEKFQSTAQQLFEVEEIAKKTGERGKASLYTISQLKRIRQNLLVAGKIGKEDFGRYAGVISFFCFLAIMIIVNILIKPSGITALAYSLGALIMSLIAGFGYGAIRFKPLLKLYAETLKPKSDKED